VSGRVALYRLALAIRSRTDKRIALVPDFICNVVNVVLETAGFVVQSYRTDELFEVDREAVEKYIASESNVAILLTASVFGSSAFLDALNENRFKALILGRKIHVIVDLCQDLNLVQYLPHNYGENLSAVISFNDKSIPGIMGGGVLTQYPLFEPEPPPALCQVLLLYRMLLLKLGARFLAEIRTRLPNRLRRKTVRGVDLRQYEYSYCRHFPYAIDIVAISKLQVILALIGLKNLRNINAVKRQFAQNCPNLVRTRHYCTSPYLVVTELVDTHEGRKIKAPYAIDHYPETSLRSELIIIHNKGFDDKLSQ
jgi:hypothetical protein